AAHAPLDVRLAPQDLRLPFRLARGGVEAGQVPGRAECVDLAVGDGGRSPRAVAAHGLGEAGAVVVADPALQPGGGVVAGNGFLAGALLDGNGGVAGNGEARIAAAARVPPHLPWGRA